MSNIPGAEVKKRTVGTEILDRLSLLIERAESTARVVDTQFSKVCRPPIPTPCVTTEEAKNTHMYPELFNEMRDIIERVENALNRIQDIASRSEV